MKYDMGNLCNTGQSGVPRPPSDLTGLLRDAVLAEDGPHKENNNRPPWEQDFKEFLHSTNQTDLENCLQFVLEVERLKLLEDELLDSPSRKRLEEIKSTQLEMMRSIASKYFSVLSDQCIALSNQVLMEEIANLRNVRQEHLKNGLKLLLAARSDNKVWQSGLEFAYRSFLATKPSPTLRAVILSIL